MIIVLYIYLNKKSNEFKNKKKIFFKSRTKSKEKKSKKFINLRP